METLHTESDLQGIDDMWQVLHSEVELFGVHIFLSSTKQTRVEQYLTPKRNDKSNYQY